MRIIGIDPSLKNTAIALIEEIHSEQSTGGLVLRPQYGQPTDCGPNLIVKTIHIDELIPGYYTEAIRNLLDPDHMLRHNEFQHKVKAGFVEDFSNVGGGTTSIKAIKSVSHSGGMAEEALAALGISMIPIPVRNWRKVVLGDPPKTPTRTGKKLMRYWTKGDKASLVPNNITPAILQVFNPIMGLDANANYSELVFGKMKNRYAPVTNFQEAMRFIVETSPTSTRIKKVFGVSLDELEAAGIALAGYRLIKSGQIEGLS